MGQEEPGREEKGALLRPAERPLQLLDSPAGDPPVPLVLILVRKRAPIHQGVVVRRPHQLLLGARADPGGRAQPLELVIGLGPAVAAVVDLAGSVGGVAMAFEILRERLDVAQRVNLAEPRRKPVNPGAGRAPAGQQAGARGIAKGRLRMGVEECRAARGQPVHVRRAHLGVPFQRPHPVVEVVNGDE